MGEYRRVSMDSDERIIFHADRTFTYREESCGMKFLGDGKYTLTKDSLLLHFDSSLDKSVRVFSEALNTDSGAQQSEISIFGGHRHRNDVEFDYVIHFNDSTVQQGTGDSYTPLFFDPASVSFVLIDGHLKTDHSPESHQKSRIEITSDSPYRYTLFKLPDDKAMYLGPLSNKRYKINIHRSMNRFKLRRSGERIEYERTSL